MIVKHKLLAATADHLAPEHVWCDCSKLSGKEPDHCVVCGAERRVWLTDGKKSKEEKT